MNIKTISWAVKNRVHEIIAQQIADVLPELVSIQKGTLYDIVFKGGTEDDYTIKEISGKYVVVDIDLESEDAIL